MESLTNSAGDISKAIADYSRSIKIDPGDGAAYYFRGRVFYELGEFDKALNDLLIALKLGGPENRKFAEDYIFKIQTQIKGLGLPSPNPEP